MGAVPSLFDTRGPLPAVVPPEGPGVYRARNRRSLGDRLIERFSAESITRASPGVVFGLLEDGSRWSDWAGPFVPRSRWAEPGTPPGTVGAVRRLGIGPLASLERVVEHVPDTRLSYVVDSWAPYRGYRADVDLVPTTDGGTRIVWQASFTPKVPGTGPLLRAFLRTVVRGFARNLAQAADRAG